MVGAFSYGELMIEAQYTANVHKRLPDYIRSWKINDQYAGGVPDAFYRHKGKDTKSIPLWIEYKFLKTLPKRDSTTIIPALSSLQLKELKEIESASNERALVIIGVERVEGIVGAAGFAVYSSEWETGISCAEARLRCLDYAGICDLIVKNTIFY